MSEYLAQVAEWAPMIAQVGFPAVVSIVLLMRFDSRLSSIEHRLVGLNRTLLIEMLSREQISIHAKVMAQQELEKLNSPLK